MKKALVGAMLVALWLPAAGRAWGRKGHEMSARVAVRTLPLDMPAFFRNAIEEMAYLCPEPDRWRDEVKTPALTALTRPDHWMKLENVPPRLPATRYDFVLANVGRKNAAGRALTVLDLGTAVFAIAEYAEMLTVEFRLWRQAPEGTEAERRTKRVIEQNVLHTAGVLAHWITDTAQPLHSTVHTNGWDPEFPNPHEYEGKGIHGRYESVFVDAAITEPDIAAKVAELRPVGDWVPEAERHVRLSFEFVPAVYEFDKQVAFGSGKESAEAKALTVSRLAAGVAALRDFWYSAWQKSARP